MSIFGPFALQEIWNVIISQLSWPSRSNYKSPPPSPWYHANNRGFYDRMFPWTFYIPNILWAKKWLQYALCIVWHIHSLDKNAKYLYERIGLQGGFSDIMLYFSDAWNVKLLCAMSEFKVEMKIPQLTWLPSQIKPRKTSCKISTYIHRPKPRVRYGGKLGDPIPLI